VRYAVALGANLGDRLAALRLAVEEIAGLGALGAVSRLYETAPVGGPEQPPFLNAAVVLDSDLAPRALLKALHGIEAGAGRERGERWGARTLDLDIVAADGEPVGDESLTIPHARAAEREFVLRPLVDVWPDAPVGPGLEARSALDGLAPQGVDEVAVRWVERREPRLGLIFVTAQFIWLLLTALALYEGGALPEGDADPIRLAGAVAAFLGGGLAFVSMRRLGPAATALPAPRKGGALVATGPYRHARHPAYGGVFLFLAGTALIVDSLLGLVMSLALLPFFYAKSEYEERLLRIRYPGYRAYRENVPRRFIPFVF